MKTLLIRGTLAGGLAAALVALGLVAHARGPHGGGGPGMALQRLIASLDLTEDQEVLAVRLRRQARDEMKAQHESNRGLLQEIKLQLSQPDPDQDRLHAIMDEIAESRTKMGHAMIDRLLQLHATLTDEQRATLIEKMDQAESRRRQRWAE